MCPIARRDLKSVHIYSVHKQDDTGKHELAEIIEGVLTGTHYDRSELKPIHDAYQSIHLTKGARRGSCGKQLARDYCRKTDCLSSAARARRTSRKGESRSRSQADRARRLYAPHIHPSHARHTHTHHTTRTTHTGTRYTHTPHIRPQGGRVFNDCSRSTHRSFNLRVFSSSRTFAIKSS